MGGDKAVDWQLPVALSGDYPWPLAIVVMQHPLLAPGGSFPPVPAPACEQVDRTAFCGLTNLTLNSQSIQSGDLSGPLLGTAV